MSNGTPEATEDLSWGRIVIAGGTDWVNIGKKDKSGKSLVDQENNPDLYEPHVMRPLCNVPIASVHGSGCASHFVAIDAAGGAWVWGRNNSSQLGLDCDQIPYLHIGNPRRLTPLSLGAPKETKFVHAAVGRGHTILVASNGQTWSAGSNSHAQCGFPVSRPEIKTFSLIENLPDATDGVIQASAGLLFTLVLTQSGKVYAFGSAEHGCLGNGRTGEDIGPNRRVFFDTIDKPEEPVRGLEDKKITQIVSGNVHSLAMDEEGLVYAWGNGGYCRTGMGHQKEVLVAKPVSGYFMGEHSATRAWKIFAGPSSSAVIDRQRMLSMAGKFKMSGDGGNGQPYTYFKPIDDLQPYKVETAAMGGMTNFAVAPDEEPPEGVAQGTIMTAGWGQQCSNGELALGNDAPLSSTRPQRLDPLTQVRVFQIAAGQFSTVFLARPGDATSALPRYPIVFHPQECVVCQKDKPDDSPLECEKCETPFHLGCLNPPLSDVPEDEWFCDRCSQEMQFFLPKPSEKAEADVPAPAPAAASEESEGHETGIGNENGDGLKRKAEDEPTVDDTEAKKQRVE